MLLVLRLESRNDAVRDCIGGSNAVHEELESAREQLLATRQRFRCVLQSSLAWPHKQEGTQGPKSLHGIHYDCVVACPWVHTRDSTTGANVRSMTGCIYPRVVPFRCPRGESCLDEETALMHVACFREYL